jgi:Zn-dependent protease with chaperone function/type II secretory pathway pseudopilin PulG
MDLLYKNESKLFITAAIISSIFWLALVIGTVGIALLFLILMWVFFVFAHSGFISYLKGTGVKITEEQYPDLHQRLIKNCKTVGLSEIPEAYLLRTDFFNALATRFLGRNFVVLFTDVVDALEDNQGAIDFYIGHELGHIERKHLIWGWFIAPAMILPLLGTGLRRAEEYTCDRYGAACCDSDAEIKAAIAAIAAGDTRWKSINIDAYLKQINATSGFWMSLNELTSDYPWLTKRMATAISAKNNQPIKHPRRNILAWLLALFIPRLGTGGGASSLIVVIAMVGILASVAVPQYQNYIEKARLVSAYQSVLELKDPVSEYALSNQAWPVSLEDIGITPENMTNIANNYSVDIYENGLLAAEVGTDLEGNSQYIMLTPTVIDGSIEWECTGNNLKINLLPPSCQ